MQLPKKLAKYQDYLDNDLISCTKHEDYDLYVMSYKHMAKYTPRFEEVENIRGLVVNSQGDIIANPFPRFLNHFEVDNPKELFDREFSVYKKLDGSLIILFCYNGEWITTTRGTFYSDQAIIAKKLIDSTNQVNLDKLTPGWTYLLEYTAPSNQIVVSYEDERVTLLGVYTENKNFLLPDYYLDDEGFQYLNKEFCTVDGYDQVIGLIKNDVNNEEGYIIRPTDRLATAYKLKFQAYWDLHKSLTRVITPRTLIEDVISTNSWEESPLYYKTKETQFTQHIRDFVDKYVANMQDHLHKGLADLRASSHEIYNDSMAKRVLLKVLNSEVDYYTVLRIYQKDIIEQCKKIL